jgi:Zn-dependent peptidase ImmA (M78 family)
MKIPKQLKIGGHTFKIVLEKDNKMLSVGNSCGKFNLETGTIVINGSQVPSGQGATLFHEIMHVINNEMGEEKIEFMAQAIYQVLSDNKLLKE